MDVLVVVVLHAAAACALRVGSHKLVAQLRVSERVGHLLGHGLGLGRNSVREKGFVDLKKCLLVIDEEVEQVALVPVREVRNLNTILRELRQTEETLFKLTRLF